MRTAIILLALAAIAFTSVLADERMKVLNIQYLLLNIVVAYIYIYLCTKDIVV